MNIFKEFEERKIDYSLMQKRINLSDWHLKDPVGISVIIPVHGRTQFNHIVSDTFYRELINYGGNVSITIVEHSENPEHEDLCRDWVNYMWIPQNGQRFNKCLCFNMGILYSSKANYYLFHDSDILVPKKFFELLFENMKGCDAGQAFSGQRLFHCSHDITEQILNGAYPLDKLSINSFGVSPARSGAEGGSIFVKREMIDKGCVFSDWACTEYSVEDSFYFRMLQISGMCGFCDDPPIDCFHLWHEPSFGRQTKKEDWERYYAFMAMNNEGKRHLRNMQADHFKKYFNA